MTKTFQKLPRGPFANSQDTLTHKRFKRTLFNRTKQSAKLQRGLPQTFADCVLALINSVLLNLLCVWILF